MTIEEAIEQLSYVDGCTLVNDEYLYKGISKAIEALEKQIQKKPIMDGRYDYDNLPYFYCPACGNEICCGQSFCESCGQAIDY